MTSRFFSKDNLSFTYQTRIRGNEDALSAYAKLFGVLQRRLFADVCSGNPTASLKSDYIRRYAIPARMFNAIKVTLEGRMSAANESQKLHRQTLEGLIARAEKQLVALVGRATPQKLHQKRRRIACEVFRLTLIREGSGCALGRRSCGAVSTILRPMATGVTPNGFRTGETLAATSSS